MRNAAGVSHFDCGSRRSRQHDREELTSKIPAPIVDANCPIFTYMPPSFRMISTAWPAARSWNASSRALSLSASHPSKCACNLICWCSRRTGATAPQNWQLRRKPGLKTAPSAHAHPAVPATPSTPSPTLRSPRRYPAIDVAIDET